MNVLVLGNILGVLVVVVRTDSWRYMCPPVAFGPWREAEASADRAQRSRARSSWKGEYRIGEINGKGKVKTFT